MSVPGEGKYVSVVKMWERRVEVHSVKLRVAEQELASARRQLGDYRMSKIRERREKRK